MGRVVYSGGSLDVAAVEIDGHVRDNASNSVSLIYQLYKVPRALKYTENI